MMPKLDEERVQKAIRMYRNKDLRIKEISNLTGISTAKLTLIYRECFKNGTLKPRNEGEALQNRVPNGQGKGAYVKKGREEHFLRLSKFSPEEQKEIAEDYYVNGYSKSKLVEKWGIHPVQLQRIREKFGSVYGKKKRGCNSNDPLISKISNEKVEVE